MGSLGNGRKNSRAAFFVKTGKEKLSMQNKIAIINIVYENSVSIKINELEGINVKIYYLGRQQ